MSTINPQKRSLELWRIIGDVPVAGISSCQVASSRWELAAAAACVGAPRDGPREHVDASEPMLVAMPDRPSRGVTEVADDKGGRRQMIERHRSPA